MSRSGEIHLSAVIGAGRAVKDTVVGSFKMGVIGQAYSASDYISSGRLGEDWEYLTQAPGSFWDKAGARWSEQWSSAWNAVADPWRRGDADAIAQQIGYGEAVVSMAIVGGKGAPARPAASPVDDVTAAIQSHVAQAVDDFDNGVIGLSDAQLAAGAENPGLLEAARGSVIGEQARRYIGQDPALSDLWLTGRGEYGPDIVDFSGQRWWDITTPGQWQMHLDKYSDGFGTGIGIFTK